MDAIKTYIEATPLMCFLLIALIYAIGDFVGTITKAWIPSIFVTALLFLIGYWTIFPTEIIADSGLNATFIGVMCPYLLVVHMGTTISVKELLKQWKTIVCCLAGLAGMCALDLIVAATGLVSRDYVVAGLPPLTGGIVATKIMVDAATAAGKDMAAIFAAVMMVVQGFAGFPITAIMLKKEGNLLMAEYNAGHAKKTESAKVDEEVGKMAVAPAKKKLIPDTPARYFSTATALTKLAVCALLAFYLGKLDFGKLFGGSFKLSGMVWALIVGVVFCSFGFLEERIMQKAGIFNFICFALMLLVFDGLKKASPEKIASMILPLIIIIAVGVIGMRITTWIAAKLLHVTSHMAFATALTALYGFPPNLILTTEACKAFAKEGTDEYNYLMDNMLPPMIVGGFTTVTVSSVIIAGVFANFL